MNRIRGILYVAISPSIFGLAPFFSITLLLAGFSAFEALSYRWGVAAIVLTLFGWCLGCNFRLVKKDLLVVSLLSLLRVTTSFSLLIAYQSTATGIASTIHFIYLLVVSLVMMFFFHEKKSLLVMLAVLMSLLGVALLSSRKLEAKSDDTIVRLVAACIPVFSYGGYTIGVRTMWTVQINSTILTCYVMGMGAAFYLIGVMAISGLHLVADGYIWLIISGLALPATAISNTILVRAIKYAGPTLTSILGAMEPLTVVVIGVFAFKELSTLNSATGILLILLAVGMVVLRKQKSQKGY